MAPLRTFTDRFAGLFAVNAADGIAGLGPLVLMIIFLVFTALYNVSLNSALTPLLNYLPKVSHTVVSMRC